MASSRSSSSVSLMASQTLILQKPTFLHPHRPSIPHRSCNQPRVRFDIFRLFLLDTLQNRIFKESWIANQRLWMLFLNALLRVMWSWCTADCGWITGHTYVTYGPLLNGATVILYEGVPNYTDCGRCWDIVDRYKVTIFYTAPTLARLLLRRANRQQTSLPSSVLSADSMHIGVLAAAANRSPFTIFYNPRACPSEFVIPLTRYQKSVFGTQLSVGMRFGMMFETDESGKRR
ncbi:hypothetical protein L2E82_39390 [Cichorium intybus]|uniref:Uncharacterized protein n=1 Tax=Cichorium intybus TaxID=13427 RepID=A0ACB9AHV3_CICIN|nr:hypothetical protein L2E82_39390 [Cichorium intybus]